MKNWHFKKGNEVYSKVRTTNKNMNPTVLVESKLIRLSSKIAAGNPNWYKEEMESDQ